MNEKNSIKPSVEKFLRQIKKSRQGSLKIYFGLAAGVGKTYRMLQEAREILSNGVDVLIGYVESHGRADTEKLLQGLPLLPRKKIYYKGREFEEFDIDAALLRHPEVIIVDEMAHSNVAGSRNEKRYLDIEELVYNGINVISAVNIQHVESLNSIVEDITGIEVKERIPDSILGLADEVVNIDITIDELLKRLKQGKVYKADKIETALQNFFRKEHLLQLRELALREVANAVEKKIFNEVEDGENAKGENILVCIGNNSEKNEKIIRRSARIAERFNSKWNVVYVETPHNPFEKMDLKNQRLLINNFKLASEFGGVSEKIMAKNIPEGILQYACEKGISKVIIGKSSYKGISGKLLGKNIIDGIIKKMQIENHDFDIEIIY